MRLPRHGAEGNPEKISDLSSNRGTVTSALHAIGLPFGIVGSIDPAPCAPLVSATVDTGSRGKEASAAKSGI